MKTLNKIFCMGALFAGVTANAQQYPIYNMQFMNQSLYNPATIGIGDQVNAMLVQKSYLTGIDGSPSTLYLNIDGPAIEDKLGVGLGVYNDRLGISNRLRVRGIGADPGGCQQDHYLDFGLSLGMLQYSIDPDKAEITDENDPLLVNKKFSSSTLDGMVGVNYTNKNFTAGIGVTQLFGTSTSLADNVSYTLERTFIGSAKYTLFLDSKRDFSISPMIVARYANSQVPQEAFVILNYKNMYYLAPSYKSTGALGITAAVNILDGFKVGYSYETIIQDPVGSYQNGGHEIMVGYSFDIRAKSNRKIEKKLDRLDEKLDEFELRQQRKDKIQDELLKQQGQDIEDNKQNIEENKKKAEELEVEIQETQKELEDLKRELKEAGILKEESASSYDNQPKGYYIVIASVKDVNISEERMKSDYLDRGFKRMYNKSTGWHYAYKAYYKDFNLALKDLRETRKGEFDDAWIHVLK